MTDKLFPRTGRALLGLAIVSALSACSVIAPYDNEFQCERNQDYGKCTDVQGAYTDALGGRMDAPAAAAGDRKEARPSEDATGRHAISRYKAAEYREMARLIEEPVTPLVIPPKVLRTLVIAYPTGEKTLYLPRYIYHFASDGRFVMGDYLNTKKPDNGSVMYPNGRSGGLR